jgi:hypothetical protein
MHGSGYNDETPMAKKRQGSDGRIAFNREHRNAKLTEEQVYAIRAEWDAGHRGKDLVPEPGVPPENGWKVTRAFVYKVTVEHYNLIGMRKRWGSLPERAT